MFRLILCLTLAGFSLGIQAQEVPDSEKDRQYVTDQLRLSLYAEPSAQSQVLKLLRSGDLLLIEEIRGSYALVTSPDGSKGWVKRGFLVTSPTSNILLDEEREKNAELFEEIERLSDSKLVIETYEKDMDVMAQKIEQLEAEKQQMESSLAELQQDEEVETEPETVAATMMSPSGFGMVEIGEKPAYLIIWDILQAYWQVILPILLALLLLSILLTKLVIEARIKSRFHGIKIW